MAELMQHATLSIIYEGVDYPICGYFMPGAVLRRSEVPCDKLLEHDAKEGILLQAGIQARLKHIYDTVILPADIKVIAQLKYPEPPASVVDFMKITRMFG